MIIVIIVGVIGFFGIITSNQIIEHMSNVISTEAPTRVIFQESNSSFEKLDKQTWIIINTSEQINLEENIIIHEKYFHEFVNWNNAILQLNSEDRSELYHQIFSMGKQYLKNSSEIILIKKEGSEISLAKKIELDSIKTNYKKLLNLAIGDINYKIFNEHEIAIKKTESQLLVTVTLYVLGVSFSSVIAILISYSIASPLKQLQKSVLQITKGNFYEYIKVQGNDEISDVSKMFNQMIKSLHRNIQLEKEINHLKSISAKNKRMITIGEFTSQIVHDIKTSLHVVINEVSLLKMRRIFSSKSPKSLDRIERNAINIDKIISHTLNFATMKPLKLSDSSLMEILQNSLDSIKIPSNITIQIPHNDIQLKCDLQMMSVVFSNLINNAIQAITEKGVISISWKKLRGYVWIEVEDSGIGMTTEQLEHIFEPLYTTKDHGIGLGLSSCKNIIKQHGGVISAHTNPTTFIIRLPIQ